MTCLLGWCRLAAVLATTRLGAFAVVTSLLLLSAHAARADLPAPPGKTRVGYAFRIDDEVADKAIVAFPISRGSDGISVVVEKGKELSPFQGWTPGLYLVPKADVAGIPKGDQDAVKTYLDGHGQPCLKQVPRVFQTSESNGIQAMTDVIGIEATAKGCESSLVKTIYKGKDGKEGQGGVDANGKRTPPAPFGDDDLDSVAAAGFTRLASAAQAPPSSATPSASATGAASAPVTSAAPQPSSSKGGASGCGGCAMTDASAHPAGSVAALGLVVGALARRRRRA